MGDVRKRKQAEKELRDREELYRSLYLYSLIHDPKVLKCIPRKADPRIGLFT